MKSIKYIEKHIRQTMVGDRAHSLLHVLRVRNWAVKIAKSEKYENIEQVEAAALLHDIGRVKKIAGLKHGAAGARYAKRFLTKEKLFSKDEIEGICQAIEHHDSNRGGEGRLLDMIRDADMLDGLGAIGILRGAIFTFEKPIYEPAHPKGRAWGKKAAYFDKRIDAGKKKADTLVDKINFQISWQDNLKTKTAKRLAKSKVRFMKDFVRYLAKEV